MKKILFLIFCFFFYCVTAFAQKTDVLFIVFDAGETNAFLPVIEHMEKEKEDFHILALATAAELIEKTPFVTKSTLLKIDKSWPREKELPAKQIKELVSSFEPHLVISGVASLIQKQFIEGFNSKAKTIAYWDNFSPNGSGDYFTTALKVQKSASYLFTPSKTVADAVEFKERKTETKWVAGHPSLEKWKEKLGRIDKEALRKKWAQNEFLITYIGGYGEAYEKAFTLFVECLKGLNQQERKVKVFVQLHPKVKDGVFEAGLLASYPHTILSSISKMSTEEAVALADLIVTYNSTVGFQALSLGKKALFVVPEDDHYSNLAIENDLANKIHSSEEFYHFMESSNSSGISSFYERLGIPENSIVHMLDLIHQLKEAP